MDCGVSGALRDRCGEGWMQPKKFMEKGELIERDQSIEKKQVAVQPSAGQLKQQGVKFIIQANGPNWRDYELPEDENEFPEFVKMVGDDIFLTITRALEIVNKLE